MKHFLGALLCVGLSVAQAETFEENIAYRCDADNKQFYFYYETVWGDLAGTTDYKRRMATCNIDGTVIKFDYKIDLSHGESGVCSSVPGGVVNVLKIGAMKALTGIGLNSCHTSRLESAVVTLQSDAIEITYCGSHYLSQVGERNGCFTEHHKKSKLPRQLYNAANFPYVKFEPNHSLQGTLRDKAALRP